MMLTFVTLVMRLLTKPCPVATPGVPYGASIRTCSWLPFLIESLTEQTVNYGVTIGRCIIISPMCIASGVVDEVVKHESVHVGQWERLGVFGFLYEYYWRERKYAYRDKPLEKEAFSVAG